MTTGGALWFNNLTIPDPYYALPVLASAFLLATVEVSLKPPVLASFIITGLVLLVG